MCHLCYDGIYTIYELVARHRQMGQHSYFLLKVFPTSPEQHTHSIITSTCYTFMSQDDLRENLVLEFQI